MGRTVIIVGVPYINQQLLFHGRCVIFAAMKWENIIGQREIKNQLRSSVAEGRISHAQLFVGKEGYGTLPLALAYASEVLSRSNPGAAAKAEHLNHVDLHFSFPTYTVDGKALSKNFFPQWREMILGNPYADGSDWNAGLDSANKQMILSVHEVSEILERFSLKSYEGGYKILIIWGADKLRTDAANKLLKFLEEPPKDTLLLLLAESADHILPTILSRCQVTQVPRLNDEVLEEVLTSEYGKDEEVARAIAYRAQGDWNAALKLLQSADADEEFETYFIQWVRNAFQAKTKPKVLKDIIRWAREIAGWNREKQRSFLEYCSEIFRQALLQNYGAPALVFKTLSQNNFRWESFAGYIHGANIEAILDELNAAALHTRRNANPKIMWTDLGIKLTRYIHRKAA